MSNFYSLGSEIRRLRKSRGESLAEASRALNINRSYLSKIELGLSRPSKLLLSQIIAHFSVEGNQARELLQLGDIRFAEVKSSEIKGKEDKLMSKKTTDAPTQPQVNVNINAENKPILFSDSLFINSTEYGLVIDFAQNVGFASGQQNVVSRIGMTFDHAKKLVQVLNDHLQKNER